MFVYRHSHNCTLYPEKATNNIFYITLTFDHPSH